MKKILFSALLALFLIGFANAQFTQNAVVSRGNSEITITFTGTLDSLTGTNDSLLSRTFSLEDYDGATNFTIYHLFNAAAGTPQICADLYASEDNVTFTFLEQITDTTNSEVPVWSANDFSHIRPKYYKMLFENTAGGGASTFTYKIRGILKDPKVN